MRKCCKETASIKDAEHQQKVREIFEEIEKLDKKMRGYITFEEALKHPKKTTAIAIYLEDYQALKSRLGGK